jgi:hypothetical protein
MVNSYDDLYSTPDLRRACIIAHIALGVYVVDITSMVVDYVRSSCEEGKKSDDAAVRSWTRRREAALKAWQADKNRLDYSAMEHLVTALAESREASTAGLPFETTQALTHPEFGGLIVRRAPQTTTRHFKPPYWTEGSFRNIIAKSLAYIGDCCDENPEGGDRTEYMSRVMAYVAHKMKIVCVPWISEDRTGQGRAMPKITAKHWRLISTARQMMSSTRLVRSQLTAASTDSPSKVVVKRALESDVNGDWDPSKLRISELHTILHKQTLPTHWPVEDVKASAGGDYVIDTYKWVRDNIDLSKPVHQLALLVGIMFSRIPLWLDQPKSTNEELGGLLGSKLTGAIRETPWSAIARRRGKADAKMDTMMVTTAIVALTEHNSPLMQYAREHNRDQEMNLGGPWSKLHGE